MMTVAEMVANAESAATDSLSIGDYTIGAQALDAAMSKRGFRGWLNRRRYLKMWGQPWRSIMVRTAESLNLATVKADSARYERSLTATVR